MIVKRTTLRPYLIGAYFTDAPTISANNVSQPYWFENKTEETMKYLPVLNLIKLNNNEEFKLCALRGSDSLMAYSAINRIAPLPPDVVQEKKVDVTPNDLFCGDIDLIFNFTRHIAVITGDNGVVKFYSPLDTTKFADFEGCILVVSITTLNSPAMVKEIYGYTNYIATMMQRYAGKTGTANEEMFNLYSFVNKCINSEQMGPKAISDTIKIARMIKIPAGTLNISNGDSVYLTNKRISISFDRLLDAAPHPMFTDMTLDNAQALETVRSNGISCYIVDNDDSIGDRYYNFAGSAKRIAKIKDPNQADGLYVIDIDASKKLTMDNFTPIDKIDEGKYIHKSIEEANIGADTKALYRDNLDIRKLDINSEYLQLKKDFQDLTHRIDTDATLRKSDSEGLSLAQRLAFEKEVADIRMQEMINKKELEEMRSLLKIAVEKNKAENEVRKQSTERFKFDYDMYKTRADYSVVGFKRDYEEGKYNRDSTIETVKTVGALSALAMGSILMFQKFGSK